MFRELRSRDLQLLQVRPGGRRQFLSRHQEHEQSGRPGGLRGRHRGGLLLDELELPHGEGGLADVQLPAGAPGLAGQPA